MRAGFFLSMLVAGATAWAGPQSQNKELARRNEAEDLVVSILRGEGNAQSHVSRLEFLGEQQFATIELGLRLRRELDARRRRNIAMAIAQLGHPACEEVLLGALSDPDATVRMSAATGLGRVKSRAAARTLVALLADPTLGVRREAARALGAVAEPGLGPPLMAAARTEGEVEVRALMLAMVGRTGDKRQAAALEGFLSSSSEGTRFGAAQGLCALGSPRGYDYARKLIASKDRYERLQGLKLFEGASARSAAPVLSALLLDEDPAVASVAARLLYQGGDARKLDWLVLRSHRATSVDDKLCFEKELETLRVTDQQRKAILGKAGIK